MAAIEVNSVQGSMMVMSPKTKAESIGIEVMAVLLMFCVNPDNKQSG